jgi:hypothetical protein
MNSTSQLDPFESALLAELRREVAEHPAPVVRPRPGRRRRLAAFGVAGIAATAAAVFSLGSGGGSPAYAVETTSSGEVIVTVHRLDDADGLQQALRAQGIDADVSYNADGPGAAVGIGPDGSLGSDGDVAPARPADGSGAMGGATGTEHGKGHVESNSGSISSGDSASDTTEAQPLPDGSGDDPCGLGADLGNEPATLTQDGSDWVLRIPADSPLQDRHVEVGTDAAGTLSVTYAGDDPGSMCGVISMHGPLPQ